MASCSWWLRGFVVHIFFVVVVYIFFVVARRITAACLKQSVV